MALVVGGLPPGAALPHRSDPLIARNNQPLLTAAANNSVLKHKYRHTSTIEAQTSALVIFDLKVLCTQYTNIDVVITYPNCAGTHKPVLALCGATPSTYWLVMVGRLKIGRPLCCHFRAKFACVKFNLLRSHSCKSGFVVPI